MHFQIPNRFYQRSIENNLLVSSSSDIAYTYFPANQIIFFCCNLVSNTGFTASFLLVSSSTRAIKSFGTTEVDEARQTGRMYDCEMSMGWYSSRITMSMFWKVQIPITKCAVIRSPCKTLGRNEAQPYCALWCISCPHLSHSSSWIRSRYVFVTTILTKYYLISYFWIGKFVTSVNVVRSVETRGE